MVLKPNPIFVPKGGGYVNNLKLFLSLTPSSGETANCKNWNNWKPVPSQLVFNTKNAHVIIRYNTEMSD